MNAMRAEHNRKLGGLLREWRRLTVVCTLTLPVGAFLLQWTATNPEFIARRWLLVASLTLAGEFWYLRRVLDQNHPRNGYKLYPKLGAGNVLTIYRGLAYAWMAGFLLLPRPGGLMDWMPSLLYLAASVADHFDGYLARRANHISRLGETLDIEYDGFGMLVAIALAVQYGQLPLIFLLVGLGRPLFVWGLLLRERMELPNHPMTPSSRRRIAAGLLMGFTAVVLWPLFRPPATFLAGAVFGGAVLLSFLRDWLVVIGWLRPQWPSYQHWRARLKRLAFGWLPVGLRLLVAACAGLLIAGPPAPHWAVAVLAAIGGLAALAGIAPRAAAVLLIGAAGLDFLLGSQTWLNLLLLTSAGLLAELGGGRFVRWAPEENWLGSTP